jgi:hypothetical protein
MILLHKLIIFASLLGGSVLTANKQMVDPDLQVLTVASPGIITVDVSNPSGVPIRMWKDSNSWGAGRWRVSLIKKGRLELFYQNPNQDFTKNNPVFEELAPHAHSTLQLDLNGGNWCGLGRCTLYGERRSGDEQIRVSTGDLLIVSYDVPASIEARNMGVWYGVVATLFVAP